MEIFDTLKINIPTAVLVEGATEPAWRDEVIDFLRQYGDINRDIAIENTDTDFDDHIVVEYKYSSALEKLSPLLPYTYTSAAGNKCCIQSLPDLYTSKICGSRTRKLMAEFRDVAKASGKHYAEILQEMMEHIGRTVPESQPLASGGAESSVDPPPTNSSGNH